MPSQVETMRAAAAHLRELVAASTQRMTGALDVSVVFRPDVAELIAGWLEAAADEYWTQDWTDCPSAAAGLPVARAILGEEVGDA